MPSVEEALQTQIRNIEASSGRTMASWTELIRATGLTKHGEILAWLNTEHGMSHGNANRVALEARAALEGGGGAGSDDPVAALYADKKAALRPIHDRVMAFINGLGSDVEVAPKKGYVSIRRRKQFAMLQPATTHVDLGSSCLASLPKVVWNRAAASTRCSATVSDSPRPRRSIATWRAGSGQRTRQLGRVRN